MSERFLFSVPSGEPVDLEPFHYAIIGQSQFSGKTTLIKRLAVWAAENGYSVLIFDTKETEADYDGFGMERPVVLRESTDSMVLIGLLESLFKHRLSMYYATLSRLTEGAKDFGDIIDRAKEMEAKTKSAFLRDACRTIYDLLGRLREETGKRPTVPHLDLAIGINRMDIHDYSIEAQQLIVKNAAEDVLRVYKRNVVLVLDESYKFIPQGYSSAATRAIMTLITQGAKTGLYVWIATQFLAPTDKDPLKACAIKFLGTQDHPTEVKHTLDLVPEYRGKFSGDDVMRLKVGQWILVRKRPPDVRTVYLRPVGVPEAEAVRVAKGEVTPEYIRDNYLKKEKKPEEEDDLVWKEKAEKLENDLAEARKVLGADAKALDSLKAEKHRLEDSLRAAEAGRAEIEKKYKDLCQRIAGLEEEVPKLREAVKEAGKVTRFVEAFRDLLPAEAPKSPVGLASVELTGEALEVHVTIQSRIVEVDATKDWAGKILQVMIMDLEKAQVGTTDISKAMAEHGWNLDPEKVRLQLINIVKQGLIVKDGTKYHLPGKVTWKAQDTRAP